MMYVIKTPLGLERIAINKLKEKGDVRIFELVPGAAVIETEVNPKDVLEIEKIWPVKFVTEAELDKIAEVGDKIEVEGSFAVRCTRRGRHPFTSIDVGIELGRRIQERTGAPVNLNNPDTVVFVEIFGKKAYIGVIPGSEERWKKKPLSEAERVLKKISVIQMPYLGPKDACLEIGRRIGRAAQSFLLKELVIAPHVPVPADQLSWFIQGVLEGMEARKEMQEKFYGIKKRIPVVVQDMYQVVYSRLDEPIIVTSAYGTPINEVREKIAEILLEASRINVLIGAREGIPKGIMRKADFVVDLAPGITFATELGIPTTIGALIACLESSPLE